ncbi:carbohydrate porin [Sphingomonas sp. NFR15]|uniref:carbohydrate porin n=1 Tax=Sphingomonas sp. NFR15 TaxID=1566282 RepID=UPI00088F36E9|nr:carbohydrate porin [Sphingomonas sp. NFR15]SDA11608.1 porin [Sphingomonas sp. NFR15]
MLASLKGACTAGVAVLSLSFAVAPAAHAQDSTVTDPATPPPPILPSQEADTVRPFQPLAAQGITLALSYTGEAAGNVSGGLRRDSAYTGQVYLGADFDMDHIVGINGGTIHFAVTNRHGDSLSAIAIGNNTSVQEVWGTQNTHLAILTWEQKLFDGRLDIEAGRSQANIHFLNSPLYCNFQTNSACGNPTFVFKNSNFTYFPASSWMAQARVQFTPRWFLHAGVYEVNPDRKRADDHGFNFSTRNATGVVVPWEAGYADDSYATRLPGHYILGGWFDRGDYADPVRDASGGIAILTGKPAATLHGRSGLYFRFDQMLTRPDPNSKRGLAVFGVAMTNLTGRVEESHYLELGLLQTGTFRGRDADTIGFLINDQQFSDLAMERMRAARMSAGGDGNIGRHQYMMELAYGAQLSPAVRISPNIQYILHPDQTGAPFRTKNIGNALVFGFKFTIDAPTLLGASRR